MGLITKLFGTYSARQLKRLEPVVRKIEGLEETYRRKSDDELRACTDTLRARLAAGETADDILPDAFALVREADARVLGKRPFRVQLFGGIILHQGRIAEMKTGEGKTLVATMPAYLNALCGRGVHIVTVNDYLARRDSEEMGRVYAFLGLTTGLVYAGQSTEEKHAAYNADITYGTNNEFGFDYLRDNMMLYRERQVQRGHAFAIVDEVDSILIDEARTPLIISGEGTESTELYDRAERFACTLTPFVVKEVGAREETDDIAGDYVVDEKARSVTLTAQGIAKAERFFGVENLSDESNATLTHHINQAIRAHGIMKRDVDYIVKNDEVIIVDSFTGRLMPGRRYNDGLHQAIEAKEHVNIRRENRTLATITFQNYFRLYRKLSGMTGTALTEEEEFREIYALDVVEVPTNKPMIRIDHQDRVYLNERGKYNAILRQIKECHDKGQPILVGTVSIDKSELLSKLLKKNGVPHTVLNAKHHEREAEIIAQAGKEGAVTISTNMAGRGTDIMLGGNAEFLAKNELRRRGYADELIAEANGIAETDNEEVLAIRALYAELCEQYRREIAPEAERVRAAGGLYILGTERHESRRIDNQLRGRSGRQGDPGESCFCLSLDDDLMRLFGSDRVRGLCTRLGMSEDEPINARILSGAIESAQKRLESENFGRRKHVLEYDDVMNQQRKLIYEQRARVLEGDDLRPTLDHMIREAIASAFDEFAVGDDPAAWDLPALNAHFVNLLHVDVPADADRETLLDLYTDAALSLYHSKDELFGSSMPEIERAILLRNVDACWIDHLDAMEDLKGAVGLNAYAQRNPISMFRLEGGELFEEMSRNIRERTVRGLLSVQPRTPDAERRVSVARNMVASLAGSNRPAPEKPANTPVRSAKKIGPNDPCPCGSGKKYKKCCGAKGGSGNT